MFYSKVKGCNITISPAELKLLVEVCFAGNGHSILMWKTTSYDQVEFGGAAQEVCCEMFRGVEPWLPKPRLSIVLGNNAKLHLPEINFPAQMVSAHPPSPSALFPTL